MRRPRISEDELDSRILAAVNDGLDIYPMIWGELNLAGVLAADLNEMLNWRLTCLCRTHRLARTWNSLDGRSEYRVTSLLERIALASSDRTQPGGSPNKTGT